MAFAIDRDQQTLQILAKAVFAKTREASTRPGRVHQGCRPTDEGLGLTPSWGGRLQVGQGEETVEVAHAVASAHLERGDEVILVGVNGSPTMGVQITSSDPGRGGRPDWDDDTDEAAGRGILIEELLAELAARGIETPRVTGIRHESGEAFGVQQREALASFLEP